jgi:hypothetical protein
MYVAWPPLSSAAANVQWTCGMKSGLSTVYLDDFPVTLMGDEARPPLSRIVLAGGKRPDRVEVRWLKSPFDPNGQAVGAEEIIDRTVEPTKPIYLRSVARPAAKPTTSTLAVAPLPALTDALIPEPANAQPPLPNADPVIAQLGAEARPGRTDPRMLAQPTAVHPASPPASGAIFSESVPPTLSRSAKRAEEQATAEAEAEQRQEEQREEEGILQDEQEALDEADEDEGSLD